MAKKKPHVSFEVSLADGDCDIPVFAYAYDRRGRLVERVEVERGKVALETSEQEVRAGRLLIGPDLGDSPSLRTLERAGAFEPLIGLREIPAVVDIPQIIIDRWPLCFCFISGRVVRPDGRPVCDARVHICEVDRIPWVIAKLPDIKVLELRDDVLDLIHNPPWPEPEPRPPEPFPGPDPSPYFRIRRAASAAVQPRLNPQPEVPSTAVSFVQPVLYQRLHSNAVPVVRAALAENYQLILPWLCYLPLWWGWFDCDEVRVLDSDADGRFQTFMVHDCTDQPDLYFWVEFDLGSGFETVHKPLIACNTHWDFQCGTEVTVTVSDPRVPACDDVQATGCDVNVLSIGQAVAIREIQGDVGGAALEGLTNPPESLEGKLAPFGGRLEPRVDFSPDLIDKGIEFYRWSYRRLSGPDGMTTTVDAASVPIGTWTPLTRDVYRHYREVTALGTSYPSYLLGPLPTSEAPAPNLFRIRPTVSPAGDSEWRVLDEHEDLASGHFETTKLAGTPVLATDTDNAAGRYELKLELFDTAGNLVNWTDAGVEPGITDQNAPFGTRTVTTSAAQNYNRMLDGTGKTVGFRMVVRVDNNRCVAEVFPVGGDISPDPDCGFHEYGATTDDVALSFRASHPNGFGTYSFDVVRGATTSVAAASTDGVTGSGGYNGFAHAGGSIYAKDVSVATLVGSCPSAAFAESVYVAAMAQNGYTRLSGYDASAIAGFALTPEVEE